MQNETYVSLFMFSCEQCSELPCVVSVLFCARHPCHADRSLILAGRDCRATVACAGRPCSQKNQRAQLQSNMESAELMGKSHIRHFSFFFLEADSESTSFAISTATLCLRSASFFGFSLAMTRFCLCFRFFSFTPLLSSDCF